VLIGGQNTIVFCHDLTEGALFQYIYLSKYLINFSYSSVKFIILS